MSKYGLRPNPTFESLLDKGETYDFENVKVYNRAAINFKNGFFGSQEPLELLDEDHDAKHEEVLAKMQAAAAELERQADAARERAREAFRAEGMPQHHAAHEAPAEPPVPPAAEAPRHDNMLSPPADFRDRLDARREKHKRNPHFDFRQDLNQLRQEARRATERNIDLNNRRRAPQQFNIASPPLSPRDPPATLQVRYGDRFAQRTAQREPQVPRPQSAPNRNQRRNEDLNRRRESAAQTARTRGRDTQETRRTRLRTPYGAVGRN